MEEGYFLIAIFHIFHLTKIQVLAYPDGPPESTCVTMIPNHSVPPEPLPSPYILTANTHCFNPGQRIILTIQDSSGEGDDYRGLFVQARMRDGLANSHGTFDTNGDIDLKTVNCFGGVSNSIGHANNVNKYVKMFGWTPPSSGISRSIVFKYTIVEDFSDFWVGLELELPKCGGSDINPGGGVNGFHPPFVPPTHPMISVIPPEITIIPLVSTNEPPLVSDMGMIPFTHPYVHPWITESCDDVSDLLCQDMNWTKCQQLHFKNRCCESCSEILADGDVGMPNPDSSDSSSIDHSYRRRKPNECPGGDFYPVCSQLPKIFCRQYLKECCVSCRL